MFSLFYRNNNHLNTGNDGFNFHNCHVSDTDDIINNYDMVQKCDNRKIDIRKCNNDIFDDEKRSNENDEKCNNENDEKCDNENDEKCSNENLLDILFNSYTEDELNKSIELSYIKYNHPLVLAYINSLKKIPYNQELHTYYDYCPISFIDFNNGDYIKILPCNHYFVPDYITKWLNNTAKCPVCNYDLVKNFGI